MFNELINKKKNLIMKKAITIKEISEALGLSRNTVSKALNGQYVPNKTRELVLRKAQEMNYKSINSGILKSKKYRILLLSGKPIHNINFFVPLIRSVSNHCYDNNYDFFEYVYNEGNSKFEKIRTFIRNIEVDGIVAIECFDEEFISKLLSLNIPICFMDFSAFKVETKQHYDYISSSNQKSVSDYIKELALNKGLKRFSFVGDYRHCLSFYERYKGLLNGLARANLSHHKEEDILESDNTFDYGSTEEIKRKIEELDHLPDCFLCCNDFVARNVIYALNEIGYNVPKDICVIGYDDANEATNEYPEITTFSLNKDFIGQEAMRVLISRIERKDIPNRTIIIDSKLIERESTKK